jgi:hypothetical protein
MTASLRSIALCVAGLTLSGQAHAQSSGDGAYGRISGDLALQLDAGGAMVGGDAALMVYGAARYLQTAGLYACYSDDFRTGVGPASRAVAFGVELRPMFLPRMSYNWEKGPAVLDLFIDSFALRAGAVVSRQPGYDLSAPGLELALAFGLPLTRSAAGPWLGASAGLRWSDLDLWHKAPFDAARASVFALTLGWQGFAGAHIVDAGDGTRR